VVLAGVFMATLDFFAVNVALPDLARDLHAGSAAIEWVVAGYGLAFAAGLITGGRLGDLAGRRRMFALGLGLFVVASAACGLAPGAGFLVGARIAQGAAAALCFPQVLAIINTAWQGEARVRAMNAYGLAAGLGAVFGQLIGGALIRADIAGLGWRTIFLVNVPVGAAALAAIPRMVPHTPAAGRARLDIPGAALVTAALVAVLLPLIEGREQGWPAWTWSSLAAAAALFAVFWMYQRRLDRRGGAPLAAPSLFKERAFTSGLAAQISFNLGLAAFFLVFALYVQQGRGLTALSSGLLFLPLGGTYLLASLAARPLAARVGRQIIAAGGLTMAVGEILLRVAVMQHAAVGWLIPGLAITGTGMGFAYAPLATMVLSRITAQHAGAAAGVLATAQQVGNAIGVAVIGVIFYSGFRTYTHAFAGCLIYLSCMALALAALVQLIPAARE
jgi:EmrB/QacA subfamily drug resistance transporter